MAGAALTAGCGSASVAELPPPAQPRASPPLAVAPAGRVVEGARLPGAASSRPDVVPVDEGAKAAVIRGREREVVLVDRRTRKRLGRADAGVGPTRGVADDRWLWVADTQGDALLVFRTRPELELVRRVFLPGGPYAIALDEEKLRLWVTLTGRNEVVELPAHGRPSELRRLPTVRQPDAVAVEPGTSRVLIGGRRALQRIDPPPLGRR